MDDLLAFGRVSQKGKGSDLGKVAEKKHCLLYARERLIAVRKTHFASIIVNEMQVDKQLVADFRVFDRVPKK